MTLAIVDSSSGRGLGGGDEPGDRLGGGRQDQHARRRSVSTGWSRNRKRVATPKLPPPPRIAQNRSGWVSASTRRSCAVRGHDVRGEERVDGQAVLAHEVADAAAERDPADPDRAGVAEAGRQAVRADALGVLGGGEPGLGPGGAPVDIDVELGEAAQVETMPPSTTPWPAPLWPPLRTETSSGPRPRARAGGPRATSSGSATRTMASGRRSMPPYDDGPGLVVAGIPGGDDRAADGGSEVLDGLGGSGHGSHAQILPKATSGRRYAEAPSGRTRSALLVQPDSYARTVYVTVILTSRASSTRVVPGRAGANT